MRARRHLVHATLGAEGGIPGPHFVHAGDADGGGAGGGAQQQHGLAGVVDGYFVGLGRDCA